MARKHQKHRRRPSEFEEIYVEAFRDISIHFPGDVYRLAEWIAMSDLALSTPTSRRGTTLHGLARQFVSLAHSFERPWTAEMVMARFREHGVEGNLVIRLRPEQAEAVAAAIANGNFEEGNST